MVTQLWQAIPPATATRPTEPARSQATPSGLATRPSGRVRSLNNTEGDFNTAVGIGPLAHNTTGSSNTAVGGDALEFNTIGSGNVAVGQAALDSNTEGGGNTAIGGFDALRNNTTAPTTRRLVVKRSLVIRTMAVIQLSVNTLATPVPAALIRSLVTAPVAALLRQTTLSASGPT